jgi:hypothetical protein
MSFNFVDLFAGIGGFHAALGAMGGKCVYASEWDKDSARIYERNWNLKPDGDITLAANDEVMNVPEHDVLVGGFPCQPFSIAGYRQGFNDFVINIFEKDAYKVAKKQWFKPSVQHIIPTAMGGPMNDIRNLMIIPLRYNILLRDSTPEEQLELVRVLTSQAYANKLKEAETLFYKKRVWSVLKD